MDKLILVLDLLAISVYCRSHECKGMIVIMGFEILGRFGFVEQSVGGRGVLLSPCGRILRRPW